MQKCSNIRALEMCLLGRPQVIAASQIGYSGGMPDRIAGAADPGRQLERRPPGSPRPNLAPGCLRSRKHFGGRMIIAVDICAVANAAAL
jgi:hypothetical protein